MSAGLLADNSGMSRAEKRAALLAIQDGVCAVCRSAVPLEADHDHATGLLRGLLCKPCNALEGKTRSQFCRSLGGEVQERFDAYRADPPAGRAWLWDFPDDWSQADTKDCRNSGLSVLEYALKVRPVLHPPVDLSEVVIATMRQRQWTEPA